MRLSPSLRLFVLLAAPCVVFALTADALAQFGWQRSELGQRPWMALSAHFVHLSTHHLLANLAALSVLCAIDSQINRSCAQQGAPASATLASAVAAMVFIDAGLLAGWWNTHWYAGLSGVLYAVFSALALHLTLYLPTARAWGVVLLLATAIKIGLDLAAGTGTAGALGIPVAPAAHAYGYCAAFSVGLARWLLRRRRL